MEYAPDSGTVDWAVALPTQEDPDSNPVIGFVINKSERQ